MKPITKILTAASTYDLTILDTVKDELSITTTAFDVTLSRYITEQSERVARYCNRVFAKEQIQDSFRFGGDQQTARLVLRRNPISSFVSLVEDGATIDSTSYEYDSDIGVVYRLNDFGQRVSFFANQIVVTYFAGFDLLAELPRPVERATIELVSMAWFSRGRDPLLKSEEATGVAKFDYWVGGLGGSLPPEIANLLDPFVIVPVG